MPTVNQMEIEGTLYDIEDTEARANASEVPAMEIRLQDVEEKASANETAIENLAQSVPVAQYAAGSTDIESFSISGASHALRDTAARALLVPATTAKTGLVKPDGSTITVDADGTIHGAPSSSLTPEYMAGGTDIIAFDVSGTSHAVRDAGARALLVPATIAQTGLVKPDGSTITVGADGTIHAVGGGGVVEMTQAAYDALTPAQKADGTVRFVYSSGVNFGNRQLVGTWTSGAAATYTISPGAAGIVMCNTWGGPLMGGVLYNFATSSARLLTEGELSILSEDLGTTKGTLVGQQITAQSATKVQYYWSSGVPASRVTANFPDLPQVSIDGGQPNVITYLFEVQSPNCIWLNARAY